LNIRAILGTLILLVSVQVNAALIDNGDWTTDDESGLEWLDLTETAGKTSYSSAESFYPGWRYATNAEVVDLFSILFVGYYDTNLILHESDSRDGSYANQLQDVNNFMTLFGFSKDVSATHDNEFSRGFYEDEDNILRLMGVFSRVTDLGGEGIYSKIHSDEYATNFDGHRDTNSDAGVYLVRQSPSPVPIPAAVWLFVTALIGLVGFSKRSKAA
jgi:hypothetical protein